MAEQQETNKTEIKTKGTSTIKKVTRWIVLILVVFVGLFIYWKYFFTYSDGYRTGLLQKMSYKGNIFKTYEGELVMSSIASTNKVALASEKFLFSVTDDSVAKAMQGLEGKAVRLHYKQKNGRLIWKGESEYIVDSAELEKGE